MSKHRAIHREVRRRGRVGALALALGVTVVVAGMAMGVLPQPGIATADSDRVVPVASALSALGTAATPPAAAPAPAPQGGVVAATTADVIDPAVPADSGSGRRIVFDQSDQRVWLIGDDGDVERTYRVSGSRYDNLKPGSYTVLSKARHATAFDASGTMQYFVRFATGFSEPIGFHSVPRDNSGHLEQTKAQLGLPLSAGCVRQWESDAIALWNFAPVGTTVTVTA